MGVLVVGSENNFSELRSRLFDGRVSTAVARRASKALAEANPHVDLSSLVPGTVLTIPDVPEIPARAELSLDDSVRDGVAGIATALTGTLVALRDEAALLEREARAERERTAEGLGDEAVKRAAAGDQDLAAALDAAARGLEDEEGATEGRRAGLEAAIEEFSGEIEALRKLAG